MRFELSLGLDVSAATPTLRCTAPVALATMTPAAAAVGVLVVAKLANKLVVAKIVGVTPT